MADALARAAGTTAPRRHLILETNTPDATDPLVLEAGATPMPNLPFMPWLGDNAAADAVDHAIETWEKRPAGTPVCLAMPWMMVRSCDVSRHDLYMAPDPDRYIAGCKAGKLDVSADVRVCRPAGTKLKQRSAPIIDVLYANCEMNPSPWQSGAGPDDTPDVAAKKNEALRRNWHVIRSIVADPKIRLAMPPSLRDLPTELGELQAALNWQTGGPRFNARQRDLGLYFKNLQVRAIRQVLAESGIVCRRLIVSFFGNWKRFVTDAVGWECYSAASLPPFTGSNYQWYGPGRLVTAKAAAMADAPGWLPHFSYWDNAEDIDDRLRYASPNGAFLWAPDPRNADHLKGVIKAYTGFRN